jgi:hypothetical protein
VWCRCIAPGSVKLGTFTAYIPVAPPEDEAEAGDCVDTIAEGGHADNSPRPSTNNVEADANGRKELREGGLAQGIESVGQSLAGELSPVPSTVTASTVKHATAVEARDNLSHARALLVLHTLHGFSPAVVSERGQLATRKSSDAYICMQSIRLRESAGTFYRKCVETVPCRA